MPKDELDIQILQHLRDGRKSFSEIAKELSVAVNTIRARVNKLTEKGSLTITGLIDPGKMDNHFLAIVAIKSKTMDLINKGEEFSKLKGVVSVSVVTGKFDLIVTVLLNSEFGLTEFYTQEVSRIEDVLSAETFVVYKNYNWKVPYVF